MTNDNVAQSIDPHEPAKIEECSICGVSYTGWGNNAAPFPGRCCNECNSDLVLPARLKRALAGKGW